MKTLCDCPTTPALAGERGFVVLIIMSIMMASIHTFPQKYKCFKYQSIFSAKAEVHQNYPRKMSCDLEDYDCADKGLLMPFVNEYTWNHGFRAAVYGIGLFWSFMAVSIIADIFMAGIETITGKTQIIQIADPEEEEGYKEIEIEVWNGTIGNLTLMALGSSAPEIMLSIIEVFKHSFYAGDLGPGTIVGSAAFNLMCITGVCIMAIPTDEVRKIKHIKVFAVTAVFSVVAYIWLIIILTVTSPDYVDVWEAVVTILMLPSMVILAYIADKDYCGKKSEEETASHLDLGKNKFISISISR